MDTSQIPSDFKEFLKLLNENKVEYLLIGGYAVNYYGYVRPTGDMDIWISLSRENAEKVVAALREFGFASPEINAELFVKEKSLVRMGVPPMRLEITNYIDGVEFSESFNERELIQIGSCNKKNAVRQKPAREQGRIISLQPSTPLLTRGLLFSSIFFDT